MPTAAFRMPVVALVFVPSGVTTAALSTANLTGTLPTTLRLASIEVPVTVTTSLPLLVTLERSSDTDRSARVGGVEPPPVPPPTAGVPALPPPPPQAASAPASATLPITCTQPP